MAKILVIYHSQDYGNTAACAELVAQGAREQGAEVECINTNQANRVDMATLAAADGLAIGSPDYMSYVAGTIKQLFDDMHLAGRDGLSFNGKPSVLFMTHGGGGSALAPFRQLASRLKLVAEPYTCRGKPTESCPELVELGRKLAKAVMR